MGMHYQACGVSFRFLAGFNRTKTTDLSVSESIGNLRDRSCIKNGCSQKWILKTYSSFFEENGPVHRIETQVLNNPNTKLSKYWQSHVVGFDWMGDEYGYPYCAFIHRRFIEIAKNMRNYQSKFGIRVHYAESLPCIPQQFRQGEETCIVFQNHLIIALHALKTICKQLTGAHLRVGHGVGFLSLDCPTAKRAQEFLKNNKITCELNMTSNLYLRLSPPAADQDRASTKSLPSFIEKQIPVVLSTDDDGVWIIHKCRSHRYHISVAAEFCRAIKHGAITNKGALLEIIDNARKAAFSDVDALAHQACETCGRLPSAT
jgi:adenosine deaminase